MEKTRRDFIVMIIGLNIGSSSIKFAPNQSNGTA
jgi:hypothetical protein